MEESLIELIAKLILTVALQFLVIYVATVMLSTYIDITPSWHLTTTIYLVGSVVSIFTKPSKGAQ